MTKREYTFRVMDAKGNTINYVATAQAERNSTSSEARVEMRKAEAVRKRDRWTTNYYQGETLLVVGCDERGRPL